MERVKKSYQQQIILRKVVGLWQLIRYRKKVINRFFLDSFLPFKTTYQQFVSGAILFQYKIEVR